MNTYTQGLEEGSVTPAEITNRPGNLERAINALKASFYPLIISAALTGCEGTPEVKYYGVPVVEEEVDPIRQDDKVRERSAKGGKPFLVQKSREGVTFSSYLVGDGENREFSVAALEKDFVSGELNAASTWSLLAEAWAYFRDLETEGNMKAWVNRNNIQQTMSKLDETKTGAFIGALTSKSANLDGAFDEKKVVLEGRKRSLNNPNPKTNPPPSPKATPPRCVTLGD